LRDIYEEDARHARALRRLIPSILRRLDARRAADQNAALETHLSPSFGEESIDDVITDELPRDAIPDHLAPDDEQGDGGDVVGFDLLDDDDEALDPVGPVANDGGTEI
jgi:hypothetical protein